MIPVILKILGLRGFTILGRLSLIFVLGRFLPLEDVGYFSFIQATIAFGILLGGMEFHAYSTREIAVADETRLSQLVASFFTATASIIALTAIALFVYFWLYQKWVEDVPVMSLAFGLVVLLWLLSEYYGTELYRLNVALNMPLQATVGLFLRNGSWPLILLLLCFMGLELTLSWVFGGALLAGWLTLAYYFFTLRKTLSNGASFRPLPSWIVQGLKVCVPLWIGVLVSRAPYFVDRMIIGAVSMSQLGVYALWLGAALLIQVFFESTATSLYMARLNQAKKDSLAQFHAVFRNFALTGIALAVAGLVALTLAFPVLVTLFDKPELAQSYSLFLILVSASFILTLSLVPQVYLYVSKQDRLTVGINILSTIVFCGFAFFLQGLEPSYTMAWSHFSTALFLFMLRGSAACWTLRTGLSQAI